MVQPLPVETVNQRTGELVPVEVEPRFMPLELSKMAAAVQYTEQFIKTILKPGEPGSGDYGIIPGTGNKPSLFKSGAEKLCFAFALAPTYEVVQMIEDHDREWETTIHFKDGGHKTIQTRGWFSYTVRCTLTNRVTEQVWATQLGKCESTERGREESNANTILKMAHKRAYVGATLNATMTSDRFTCDVEDMRQAPASPSKSAAPTKPANEDGAVEFRMKSNKEGPTWCAFCRTKHINMGDDICKVTIDGKANWGVEDCYKKSVDVIDQAPAEGDDLPFDEAGELKDDKFTAYLKGLKKDELVNFVNDGILKGTGEDDQKYSVFVATAVNDGMITSEDLSANTKTQLVALALHIRDKLNG